MVAGETGAGYFILPIGAFAEIHGAGSHTRIKVRPAAYELVAAQHVVFFGNLRDTERVAVFQNTLAGLTALGGDDHHTVGAARTVDGRSGGILQDVDAGDIVGIQEVERVAGRSGADTAVVHVARGLVAAERHTVHYEERVVAAANGGRTADTDVDTAAGFAVVVGDAHTGCAALDQLLGRDNVAVEILFGDRRNGAGRVALFTVP